MTGNMRDLRVNGKRVINVTRLTGCEDYLPVSKDGYTFTASYTGWYYRHDVGVGSTEEKALADLEEQTGLKASEAQVSQQW